MGIAENICAPILAGSPQAFPNTFGVLGANWALLCMLSIMVSLAILVLAYMLGSMLRNQQLLAWTKFEVFQIFVTVVIFAISAMIIIGMCSFDMSFLDSSAGSRFLDPATGKGLNMYKIVDNYFSAVTEAGMLLFTYMMFIIKSINMVARTTWYSNPFGVGMTDSPLNSLTQVNQIFFFMVSGFFTSVILLQLQMRMMEYMSIATLFYLFPFGLFFRSFEPTRSFGGTLIGISIAFFLFFPMLVVFNDYIAYAPMHDSNAEVEQKMTNANTIDPFGTYLLPEFIRDKIKSTADQKELEKIPSSIGAGVLFLFKPIMVYFVAAIALPVINFIVLVEITKSLTRLIGEEVDVSNLTRLI